MIFEEIKADGMTSLVNRAHERIRNGYSFPPLPETNGEWTDEFSSFAKRCASILKQRQNDFTLTSDVSVRDSIHPKYSDAITHFNIAIVAKDTALISVYHRVIMDAESPASIKLCVRILRNIYPGMAAAAVYTEDHLQTQQSINTAVWDWEGYNTLDYDARNRLIDDLTAFAYEDLSQTDRILSFIRRGVVEPEDIRRMLKVTADIRTPLLEGTL